MDKKFIVTKDKSVADKLLAAGFNLVSSSAGVWTFQSITPKNFSFENIDRTAIAYTNILSI
jgi:hypothetical protein